MINRVARFIEQKELLHIEEKTVVAISGGSDSVALLLVLHILGYDCAALHCNFHLRGEESLRDENFVKELCKRLNIPLKIVEFDTAEYAANKKISIEMAAREQRYNAFEEHRKAIGATSIAVAHHRDDSAETLILNLIRGTGIKGLRGIQPKNRKIVRPLLCVGHNDILEFLKQRGETFVTDSTNLTTDFTRNKIRLEILPLMGKINPSIIESIAQTAEYLNETDKIYTRAIEEGKKRVRKDNIIFIKKLQEEASPQTLLFEMLQPFGFNSTQTKNIYNSLNSEGSRTFESNDWTITKDRNTLILLQKERETFNPVILPIDQGTITPYGTIDCIAKVFDGTIIKDKNIAMLDANKITLPLTVRQWREGDRFTPFGMHGSKLVSDYITDCKMSFTEKMQQLVITDAKEHILWLIGERTSDICKIDKKTTKVILIKWQKNK